MFILYQAAATALYIVALDVQTKSATKHNVGHRPNNALNNPQPVAMTQQQPQYYQPQQQVYQPQQQVYQPQQQVYQPQMIGSQNQPLYG